MHQNMSEITRTKLNTDPYITADRKNK